MWGALATAPTSGPACVDGVGLGSHVKNTARQTAATMVSGPPTAMTALGIELAGAFVVNLIEDDPTPVPFTRSRVTF
ncbi:MAG: hypothetical protein DI576_10835, partial [Actinomyces sp.]